MRSPHLPCGQTGSRDERQASVWNKTGPLPRTTPLCAALSLGSGDSYLTSERVSQDRKKKLVKQDVNPFGNKKKKGFHCVHVQINTQERVLVFSLVYCMWEKMWCFQQLLSVLCPLVRFDTFKAMYKT